MRRRSGLCTVLIGSAAVLTLMATPATSGTLAATDNSSPRGTPLRLNERPVVARLLVPDASTIRALRTDGVDLTNAMRTVERGIEVVGFVRPSRFDELRARGVEVVDSRPARSQRAARSDLKASPGRLQPETSQRRGHGGDQVPPSAERPRSGSTAPGPGSPGGSDDRGRTRPAPQVEPGPLRVLRADWFTNRDGTFLSVEARSVFGRDDTVTVTYPTPDGAVTRELNAFVDAGEYLYHRFPNPRPTVPDPGEITVSLDDGTTVEVTPTEWTATSRSSHPPGLEWGFTDDGYVDAVQSDAVIEQLAAKFPDLAEVIELPYETHGYRKKAQALIGSTTENAFFVTTHGWGHEGGNAYNLEVFEGEGANAPLDVTLDGTTVRVELATDGSGEPSSTAAEVVDAINASAAAAVLTAHTYPDSEGGGIAETGSADITDGLDAPSYYPHEPYTVKAIRIGKDRDGSKTGVLMYSLEHAREWVTPLVALETAQRLLRNYDNSPHVRELVDNLDIFIVPIVNPDGGAYALYDDPFKRKNMNNYCSPGSSPPNLTTSLGVDVNRNFRIGSRLDGYFGASGDCLSGVFSGPSEASEAEAKNQLWLVDEFDNIKFAMNTHSFGGYFMWSPGAYKLDGREPLPRPSIGIENYFFQASRHILSRVKEHRGTVVHPGRTGPVIDVLYSAAGNSADDHYYRNENSDDVDIFAWDFEVGADIWNGDEWDSPNFFWPDFETEGFDQAMEFANGWMGIFEVALSWARDDDAPDSRVNVSNGSRYDGPVDVVFEADEPATIHYTLDGSRPTRDSPTLQRLGLRGDAAPIEVEETTTLKWFSVDAAGNVEDGYNPGGNGHNYEKVKIRIDNSG